MQKERRQQDDTFRHVVFDDEVNQLPLFRSPETNEELEPAYPALGLVAGFCETQLSVLL